VEVGLLGSGGWIPTETRETCAAYAREGSRLLLVDAGTGLRRLLAHPELLDGVDGVDLVLTHFHLDHVVGLAYLPGLGLPAPPTVWAPGAALYGTPSHELLSRLVGPPWFALGLDSVVGEVHELEPGSLDVGPFPLRIRRQERHAQPTLALRIGDDVAYCTDTAYDPANAEFAAGASVLVHEAWHAADTSSDDGHTAAGDAARLAQAAGVSSLVLIHLNPAHDDHAATLAAARAVFPATELGHDLRRVV
jgi:ribonuclease BN (tRNA processing enzyme)